MYSGRRVSGFKRVLGPFDAMCVVVGAIIGVGIFFTPSQVAGIAGSGGVALAAWAVGGVIALLGALSCAELGGMYLNTASHYTVLRDSYGSALAFLYVFTTLTASQAGAIAIIAIVCAQNISIAVNGAVATQPQVITMAAVLVAVLAAANVRGVLWGAGIQNLTVIAKVAALVAVAVLAALAGAAPVTGEVEAAARAPVGGGVFVAIFAALVPAFFAYGGWMQLMWMSGEVRDAERNVPRAITGGVLLVVVVYLLANWAYLRLLGPTDVARSEAIAADAVAVAWPGLGTRLAAGVVAISAFGVLNAGLLTCPRLVQGMAADGRFFRSFSTVSARFRTPIAAIVLIAAMSLVLLVIAALDERPVSMLTIGVVFIDSLFAALTGAAVIVLRWRAPDLPRPVRVPFFPWVPLLFVIGEIGIVAGAYADASTRVASLIGFAWIVISMACWYVFFRGRGEKEASAKATADRKATGGPPAP